MKKMGLKQIMDIPAKDKSVPCGYRPNMVVTLGPPKGNRVWILGHLDVVPAGDRKNWKTDPFKVVQKGNKLFGRGTEDNHQGFVSGLLALRAFIETGTPLPRPVGLVLVSDEETGSNFGLKHILKVKKSLFKKDDLFIVPDAGEPDARMVEIAEKSILWLKISVHGRQCHASTPEKGINAFRAGSALAVKLNKLHRLFPSRKRVFDPPISTFEPTKKDANVPNVNTIPGEDVFYVDCRVLPHYKLNDVLKRAREMATAIEKKYKVKVKIEPEYKEQAAPPTPETAPVVKALMAAIPKVYRVKPVPMGIGGGTVAAIFRNAGFPAAVWSKIEDLAHQPNEFSTIDNTLGDAKVFAHVFLYG
jgi:succinyl-diaminopimelate desuccinylase